MADSDMSEDEDPSFISRTLSTVLSPLQLLVSKSAQRAYISAALLLLTSLFLLGTAITAYLVFYYSYIPTRGFSREIHLQFSPFLPPASLSSPSYPQAQAPSPLQPAHAHAESEQPPFSSSSADPLTNPASHLPPSSYHFPYGHTSLSSLLISHQPYDISIHLLLPRTPSNTQTGNFMIRTTLLASPLAAPLQTLASLAATVAGQDNERPENLIAESTRAAILPYRSKALEALDMLLRVPWYVVGLGRGREEERLEVGMWEGVWFEKGWRNVPRAVRVEIRSREVMQVYRCWVRVEARLSGLRYIMYSHRILSFLFFTTLFYTIEVTSLLLTWAVLSFFIFPSTTGLYNPSRRQIKPEPREMKEEPTGSSTQIKHEQEQDEDGEILSDTSRTYPTYSRQPPLRYSSPSSRLGIKKEEEEEDGEEVLLAAGEAADDEDDDEANDFVLEDDSRFLTRERDSGLGTSMESGTERREGVRRRRSGGGGR